MKIGHFLRRFRADVSRGVWDDPGLAAPETIALSSPSFADGEHLHRRHTAVRGGDDVSPPLAWTGVPDGTRELVLFLEDIDVPFRTPLVHTAAVMPGDLDHLDEGAFVAGTPNLRFARTLLGRNGYSGPAPIPGHGPHRYRFMLFALSTPVPDDDLKNASTLRRAVSGSVLARGLLCGVYER